MITYKLKHIIAACSVCCGFAVALTSCSDDEVDKNISVIVDTQTPQNDLDRWLEKNYVEKNPDGSWRVIICPSM